MEAGVEFSRVMRDCHVMLINATKTCSTSIAGDLFGESLITEEVKANMSLNITEHQKAEKLIDCVRTKVASAPEKIYVFIKVLRRHGGEEAAKTLEGMLSSVPGLPKLPKLPQKLNEMDPVPTREQLARVLQSPPVGREDIAQQVVPGLSKLPKSHQKVQKDTKCMLGCLIITDLALFMILGVIVYGDDTSTQSLPVLKQELIGREEEMEVIMGYFIESEVDVVTLYGQAGFGKSEIALHVGHRILQLGLDVHYIRVENFVGVENLEKELMEISDSTSYTNKRLVKWAKGLTKKTLLILDNVDGQNWVSDTSRWQLKELFLNPLLDNTFHLQVLITSQQDMMTTHAYRSYRLYSLSTEDCVHLMVNHSRNAESEFDTADTDDLRVICDLVGNVPFASKILAKTLSSGTSAKYIIQGLSEKSKLKIIANKADMVEKDRLLSAIELAFQFIKPECQISTFILIKFQYPFTLYEVSPYITADMMSRYIDFDLSECLLELTTKSFLEVRYYFIKRYHFHELIVDYLENSNYELTEIFQAYWKYRLSSGNVHQHPRPDNNDYFALTQIVNHDDSFSFEASIALMLNLYFTRQNLSSAARVLVSHCEVQDYNSTRLNTYDMIQGYTTLLQHVICQEEFPTEWNCMDAISLCLPLIDKLFDLSVPLLYIDVGFSCFILKKCRETGSAYNFCESIWKHSLYIYIAYEKFISSSSMDTYFDYDEVELQVHLALEDTSSPYNFMAYMILYANYSRQGNLTGMEESLAGIHKLDFQQINITCYTYSADYEDPYVTTAILFLQQVNETKLADKLHSKLFVATYAKMGCCDSKPHLLNSLYRDEHCCCLHPKKIRKQQQLYMFSGKCMSLFIVIKYLYIISLYYYILYIFYIQGEKLIQNKIIMTGRSDLILYVLLLAMVLINIVISLFTHLYLFPLAVIVLLYLHVMILFYLRIEKRFL